MGLSYEDLLKVVIGLGSAFAGWLLAQLTSSFKTWRQRRRVLKLLIEELTDLDAEINRLYFYYARQLELHGAKAVSGESPAGLSNPIYRGYYKDALLSLNQNQRISYQIIHSLVDMVNLGLADLRCKSSDIYAKRATNGMTDELARICDAWGKEVEAQFMSCASLQWQVRFHLQHRNGPDLRPNTKYHEDYLKYLEDMRRRAQEFIANGNTIEKSKFNKIYDPSIFSKLSP